MKIVRSALVALAAAGLVSVAAPAMAEDAPAPSPAVQACLDRHPGAVTYLTVTPDNDTVCVDTLTAPSLGDDTYLWVGADTDENVDLYGVGDPNDGVVEPDPGVDTLSLADWTVPLVETYNAIGVGGLFGVRVINIDNPEAVTYTAFDDVIGDPAACSSQGYGAPTSVDLTLRLGAGADTVQCTLGTILTEGGDDTITGVTQGASVQAGPGEDTVTGDADADSIVLGGDNDTAFIRNGGVDTVKAGTGIDTVYASRNDVVSGAESVKYPTTTTTASAPKHAANCHRHHGKRHCHKHHNHR